MISTKVFCLSNKPLQAVLHQHQYIVKRYSITSATSTPTRTEGKRTSREEASTLFLLNRLLLMTINSRSNVVERKTTTNSLAQAVPMSAALSVARVHLVKADLQMLLKLITQSNISKELDIQDNLEAVKLLTP